MTVPSKLTIIYIILHANFIFTQCKYLYSELNPALEEQLNKEARRAECCAKKMRCCKRHPPPPNIEIRAVLTRCIDAPTTCYRNRNLKKPLNLGNLHNLQRFQGFDEDEPLVQSEVTKCAKKVILTLKIRNDGYTNTQNQFIVVDHVFDPVTDKIVRLLNPYVIKMKQEQISQDYAMKFIDFVNSQAREQVYNKHDGNYTGCCTGLSNPTCGVVKFHGKPVPFSTGFCCSCDARKNAERQPPSEQKTIGYSDPAYLLDAVPCPRTHIGVSVDQLRKSDEREKEKLLKAIRKHQHEAQKAAEALAKADQKRDKDSDNIFYIGLQKKNLKDGKKITKRNRNYPEELELKETDMISPTGSKEALTDRDSEYDKISSMKIENIRKQLEEYKENINTKLMNSKDMPEGGTHRDYAMDRSQKPSMHEILNSENSNKFHSIKNSIKKIADKAFKETFQGATTEKPTLDAGLSPEEEFDFDSPASIFAKRQVQSSGVQRRGGQNCADRYTPANQDPETYHESTHCLKFSPVWYGLYKLGKPVVEQRIYFQVFQKYETSCGKTRWKDLTRGRKVKLGSFWPQYKDELPTISMTFTSVYDDEDFCLDYKKLRLLVPEGLKVADLIKFPEARAGPSEYLLVPKDKITITGDQCDVAGVGFEAFFKQPNRCSMPRGSCLHHQPFHLWHHDKRLDRLNKRGCYFLKFYGVLSDNPVRKNTSAADGERLLSFNYYGRYISLIDMEINADFNAVLRTSSSAVITEVYIDSTCPSKTSFTVKVSNNGLLSTRFMVRVCDCPLDVEDKFTDVISDLIVVPPQNQHIFYLALHVPLKLDIFYCSVEVLNADKELVALRRIKIQKMDRCVCTWHCLCACIGSSTGLKCIPMKIDHYHAAGFKGGLPIISRVDHFTLTNDILNLIFFVILFVIFLLFVLGLTKALLGLCCVRIGMWGLNILLDLPKPMNRYYDKDIMDRPVRYDASGWPIHPDTGERTRNIPASTEFCINVMFFFTYPTVIFILLLKRICHPFHKYPRRQEEELKRWKCNLKSCLHRKEPDEEKPKKKPSKKTKDNIDAQETNAEASNPDETKGGSKKSTKVSISEGPKNQIAPPPEKPKSAKSAGGDTTDNPYYYTSTDENTSESTSAPSSAKGSGNRTNVSTVK